MNPLALKDLLAGLKVPAYRYAQAVQSIKQGIASWDQIKGWPQSLITGVKAKQPFLSFTLSSVNVSKDGTVKALLRLDDGGLIETVLMQPKPGLYSVCVSCEVGCPMKCAFCATGAMGFKRLLTSAEICDQWLFWLHYTAVQNIPVPKRVVFMGMGEPFHNLDYVFQAIDWLTDPEYIGLGQRKITVSTSGLIPGINTFMRRFPQINLAISLHSANPEIRSGLMPVNRAFPLADLQTEIKSYVTQTRRQVTFEYLLLQDLTDTKAAASELVEWLKVLPKHLVHVNLIRYNQTGSGFVSPSRNRVRWFKDTLQQQGISVSIRKNLGTDIAGACGQLAGKATPVSL